MPFHAFPCHASASAGATGRVLPKNSESNKKNGHFALDESWDEAAVALRGTTRIFT
jgi:hypothetical protein